MNIVRNPVKSEWPLLLERPRLNYHALEDQIQKIIDDVAANGDAAVKAYTKEFDKYDAATLKVSPEEIKTASNQVSSELKKAIDEAHWNIQTFHKKQMHHTETIVTTAGVRCWQKPVPMSKVGLYIPGGSAPLLSTALMLGIPAKIAGCREVILCTPPDSEGKVSSSILYIAGLLGIEKVFKVGGA